MGAILWEYRKRHLAVRGGVALCGLLTVFLGTGAYFLCRQQQLSEQEGDLICVPDENRLFAGQDTAPCLLLTKNSEKKTQISLAENEEPVSVLAELTEEGLTLSVTDASGSSYKFRLSNQYEIAESYPDTSLFGEVLFFDTDEDRKDEIWVAISDRALVNLLNGETAINQNYMAGWCIFQKEDGSFALAEGQLLTKGSFEIGTVNPMGIWQEFEFEAYVLEGDFLAYMPW